MKGVAMNYAQIFKKHPEEIEKALKAIEVVTDELSRKSFSEKARKKWDIVHRHIMKSAAICWLVNKKPDRTE
jgi:Skp family chaperone for outer membrane proteins